MGVSRLPGSTHVLERSTGNLVPCSEALCPFADATELHVSIRLDCRVPCCCCHSAVLHCTVLHTLARYLAAYTAVLCMWCDVRRARLCSQRRYNKAGDRRSAVALVQLDAAMKNVSSLTTIICAAMKIVRSLAILSACASMHRTVLHALPVAPSALLDTAAPHGRSCHACDPGRHHEACEPGPLQRLRGLDWRRQHAGVSRAAGRRLPLLVIPHKPQGQQLCSVLAAMVWLHHRGSRPRMPAELACASRQSGTGQPIRLSGYGTSWARRLACPGVHNAHPATL
jgi:hypothetical protein